MLRVAVLLAVFLAPFITTARAEKLYDDEKTAEGWAWKHIRNNQAADFLDRCGMLDPRTKFGWDDPCRQISAKFLIDVLTVPEWRDQVAQRRVRLRGVHIDGTLDLSAAEIVSEVWIEVSRISGDIVLSDTHWSRPLSLRGSNIEGNVDLRGAKVQGIRMENSTFVGAIDARGIRAAGLWSMEGAIFLDNMSLVSAEVEGDLVWTTLHSEDL